MSQDTLKRSYNDMKVGIPVNGIPVNGIPVNGINVNNTSNLGSGNNGLNSASIQTRNNHFQQQQQQQRQGQPSLHNIQQQQQQQLQKHALLNGNTHGLAHQTTSRAKSYKFTETSEEILAKYSKLPPSLEFHIHENHYRFGNQDGIISKNNQLIKDFLEFVAREEIPPAIVEVLRDAGIRFYEGCIILKILDHRHSIEHEITNKETQAKEVHQIPKTYQSLLKPTQLSLFYDLLYQTDSALQRFSDNLGISMESEILSITKRNLDLSVPLNLYKASNPANIPKSEFPKINKSTGEILHDHRIESNDPNSKSFKPFKELHEDSTERSSEYEQFMLIMNEKSNNHNLGDSGSDTNQFTRLRFIEQFRLKKEKLKQASISANLSQKSFSIGNAGANLTPQQSQPQTQSQQPQSLQQQQQQGGDFQQGQRIGSNTNLTALQQQQQQLQQQKAIAQQKLQQGSLDEDTKKKKPKKLTKKQQAAAAAAAAAAGTDGGLGQGAGPSQGQVSGKTLPGYSDKTLPGVGAGNNEAPKKKRGSYKKRKKDGENV